LTNSYRNGPPDRRSFAAAVDRRAQVARRHFEESVVRWDSDHAAGFLVSLCAKPIEALPGTAVGKLDVRSRGLVQILENNQQSGKIASVLVSIGSS
jgi:hypothetical protein